MARKETTRAVYPGTFDPVTKGHLSLIERACHIFDELVVAVAENAGKDPLFDFDERVRLMTKAVEDLSDAKRIKVIGFNGLTADLARDLNADAIIRGLRAISDFEFEFQMALMNRKLARETETVFLMPALSWVYLSSSLVKDVALNGGDITGLVPAAVREALAGKFQAN